MNYFKILGLVFGLLAFLKPFYMHILPWDENKGIEKAYSKERPKWVILVSIIGLGLVALTWYKEVTTEIKYSLILTVLFSLTLIKALILLFDYEKFQKWIASMLKKNKGKQIVFIDIGAGIFGFIIILITLFLY